MYDVLVVGARVAGAATGMLLARRGLRVLVVDRVRFPSDTVSTHQVQVPGGARLARWGLLDRVVAAGTPAARTVRFDTGDVVLRGRLPTLDGVDAVYSPRRTVLDALMVEAAREAGAEVRERFAVEEVLGAGRTVTGVVGRTANGSRTRESARLVVGADGRHSLVAAAVGAPVSLRSAPATVAVYTYWSGLDVDGGELFSRGRQRRAVGAWPTNEGLTMTYVAAPVDELRAVRADPSTHLMTALDLCGDLGERVRSGKRVHRVVTTPDVPAHVRRPYGPGWALVGDSGLVMDPVTGMGISHAFRDAELLADAVASGLDHGGLATALPRYHVARDAAALPMYRFTEEVARLAPPRPEQQLLMQAVADSPARTAQFLAVLTGTVPVDEYFASRNLMRVLGLRGMLKAARQRRRAA